MYLNYGYTPIKKDQPKPKQKNFKYLIKFKCIGSEGLKLEMNRYVPTRRFYGHDYSISHYYLCAFIIITFVKLVRHEINLRILI